MSKEKLLPAENQDLSGSLDVSSKLNVKYISVTENGAHRVLQEYKIVAEASWSWVGHLLAATSLIITLYTSYEQFNEVVKNINIIVIFITGSLSIRGILIHWNSRSKGIDFIINKLKEVDKPSAELSSPLSSAKVNAPPLKPLNLTPNFTRSHKIEPGRGL